MPFATYIERLQGILERIRTEQDQAITEAGRIAATALAGGGVIHIFGSGHSHMIAEEAFYRAGGIAGINPILDDRLSFKTGALDSTRAEREPGYARMLISRESIGTKDVGIVVSNSGRNPAPVEMAIEMKLRGLPVIAITNVAQSSRALSRDESGKRLFEVATIVIDTCVADGDALLRLPGLQHPMGPSSTVAGAAIVNSIIIEAAAELLRNGNSVPVFPSANAGGTSEQVLYDLFRPYQDRIRYFDGP